MYTFSTGPAVGQQLKADITRTLVRSFSIDTQVMTTGFTVQALVHV